MKLLDLRSMTNPYWIPRHYIKKFCQANGQAISGRILDFGCGSMPYATCFANAKHYTGIEYDRNLSPGKHYIKGNVFFYDGRKLPFPDNHFDAIVSFQVIEHVENLQDVLSELRRVSRPGAKLLFTGPLLWPEHETPYDFRRFTRWGAIQTLRGAGLAVDSVEPLGSIYDLLCVFLLDYLNTHRSTLARQSCRLISPAINLISTILNRLDPWASRSNRYCYLDLAMLARNPN